MSAVKWYAGHGSLGQAVAILREELARRGIREYAVVDHAADMTAVGAVPFPAYTLIFGNPRLGSQLLAESLASVVDIPLRIGVYQNGSTVHLGYRDMTRLLENLATTHATLAPKLSQANTVLEDLVKAVIDRLTPDTPAL